MLSEPVRTLSLNQMIRMSVFIMILHRLLRSKVRHFKIKLSKLVPVRCKDGEFPWKMPIHIFWLFQKIKMPPSLLVSLQKTKYYFCCDSIRLENKIFLVSLWRPWRLQNCITRFKTFAQIHCSTTRVQRGKIRKGNCERLFRMWRGHENWWKLKRWNVWINCYNSFAQVSNNDIVIHNLT